MMYADKKIVIVEDDREISRLSCMLLESEGYKVSAVYCGSEAVSVVKTVQPDLVILDIMLPGIDGVEVCRLLREFFNGPVLMLTGVDDDITEVAAFKKGADDFVKKPFNSYALVARIEALLRRYNPHGSLDDVIETGCLKIISSRREAYIKGKLFDLTNAELDLLVLLARNVGELVSREQCCNSLRGFEYDGYDRSIDIRVSSLRKKLAESDEGDMIKTVRGKGYMLVRPLN